MKRLFAIFLVLLVAAILIAPAVDLAPTVVAAGKAAAILLLAAGFLLAAVMRRPRIGASLVSNHAILLSEGRACSPPASRLHLSCELRR